MTVSVAIAAAALALWLYLLLARGGFWRASVGVGGDAVSEPASWPGVVAVIPARDEAELIERTLGSLLRQDYPGPFGVILVDDQSTDATAAVARSAAKHAGAVDALAIVSGSALPGGWTGKLWAVKQGIDRADGTGRPPDYLLLTDADIVYDQHVLKRLVGYAQANGLVLTSLMVKLRCESAAEKALIPAFVFFFQMLYPFAWVNRPDCRTAAAAGGCMLVRRDALRAAGGVEAIRHSWIDDCALARKLKTIGPIWLGLTEHVRSLRPYPRTRDIGSMVSRSAYDQLGYSPLLLVATIAGMALIYLAPPTLALFGTGLAQILGAVAWLLMAAAFQPILRFFRRSPIWGLALPAIAGAYLAFTIDSAYQHMRGRGGFWKGRVQADVSGLR